MIKDMRNLIINLIILLESKVEPLLAKYVKLNPKSIQTLLKYDGLNNFIKYQLPLILSEEDNKELIEATVRIYEARNSIIHRKSNIGWNSSNLENVAKIESLLKKIDDILETEPKSFSLQRFNILGTVIEVVKEQGMQLVQMDLLENKTQELFHSFHKLTFSDNLIKQVIDYIVTQNILESPKGVTTKISENKLAAKLSDSKSIMFCFIPPFNLSQFNQTIQAYITELVDKSDRGKSAFVVYVFSGITIQMHKQIYSTRIILKSIEDEEETIVDKILTLNVLIAAFKQVYDLFHGRDEIPQDELIELLKSTFLDGDIFLMAIYFAIHFNKENRDGTNYFSLKEKNYEFDV